MPLLGATCVFAISLLAIPATYSTNWIVSVYSNSPFVIFCFGVAWLTIIIILSYLATRDKHGKPSDPLYYLLGIFTFSSITDLILALENDGFIEGFMEFYLCNGEPYLKTAYGTMICYWDGTGHFAMYLMMLSAMSWGQSYRDVALYWIGSIGHSMIVLLLGSLIGNIGIKWSFLLNMPYLIIPFVWAVRLLFSDSKEKEEEEDTKPMRNVEYRSLWRRPVDLLLACYLVGALLTAVLRGLAVLGSQWTLAKVYSEKYEPYLNDPSAYPKVQMLVYLFYFVPFYVMSLYGLVCPGNKWMIEWSLLHGGAAAQAQISHIGSSIHSRTPFLLRVSEDFSVSIYFWIINVALLIVPQLMVYRITSYQDFFLKRQEKAKTS